MVLGAKKVLALILGCGIAGNVLGGQMKSTWPQNPRFDSLADQNFLPLNQGDWFPGFIVGVSHDGVRRFKAYGANSLSAKAAIGPDAICYMGSVGKLFTSLLTLELVEEGKIDLDAPAKKYFPSWFSLPTRDGKEISVRHLLLHLSGLPGTKFTIPKDYQWKSPDQEHRAVEVLNMEPLQSAPGEEYGYSPMGYSLLGWIDERAAGADYESLMRKRFWDPLGMKDTGTQITTEQISRSVQGHKDDGNESRPLKPFKRGTHSLTVGSGGTFSTANDMLTFAEAIYQHKDARIDRMVKQYTELSKDFSGYGPHAIRHGGQAPGYYCANFASDWESKAGMIMLANTGTYTIVMASDHFFNAKPWESQDNSQTKPAAAPPVLKRSLRKLTGLYRDEQDKDFWYLEYAGGKLAFAAPWSWEFGRQEMTEAGVGHLKVPGWKADFFYDPGRTPVVLTGKEEGKPDTTLTQVAKAYIRHPVDPSRIGGVWKGNLKLGTTTEEMLLKVDTLGDGVAVAKFAAGDHFNCRIDAISFEDDVVEFQAGALNGMFVGQMSPDGKTISGYWCQGGVFPVSLKRQKKAPEVKWYEFQPGVAN